MKKGRKQDATEKGGMKEMDGATARKDRQTRRHRDSGRRGVRKVQGPG